MGAQMSYILFQMQIMWLFFSWKMWIRCECVFLWVWVFQVKKMMWIKNGIFLFIFLLFFLTSNARIFFFKYEHMYYIVWTIKWYEHADCDQINNWNSLKFSIERNFNAFSISVHLFPFSFISVYRNWVLIRVKWFSEIVSKENVYRICFQQFCCFF